MMSPHLRETEFVDLLDGTLPAARAQHLESCTACREQADALSRAVSHAADVDVPEPSPMFWDHFSARVRETIADEPQPGGWRTLATPAVRWSAVAAAAVLALTVTMWPAADRTPADAPPRIDQTRAESAPGDDALADDLFNGIEADEAWAIVQTVADDLALADMDDAGLGVRPGSADRVARGLSETERRELAELLEHAMRAQKTAESPS